MYPCYGLLWLCYLWLVDRVALLSLNEDPPERMELTSTYDVVTKKVCMSKNKKVSRVLIASTRPASDIDI